MANPKTKIPDPTPAPEPELNAAPPPPVSEAPVPGPTEDEEILKLFQEIGARGTSDDPRDKVLPLIRLLQSNSPQVNRRGVGYVEDATAGDFYFRLAEQEVVRGDEGFIFRPLGFAKAWVEWRPNRGGYANQYQEIPAEAAWKKVRNAESGADQDLLVMPSGNYIEETVYSYGYVGNDELWVIPFRSSGLGAFREFNTRLGKLRFAPGVKIPAWASIWRVTSASIQDKEGHEWFTFRFALVAKYGEAGGPTAAMVKAGVVANLELANEMKVGARKLEFVKDDASESDTTKGVGFAQPQREPGEDRDQDGIPF